MRAVSDTSPFIALNSTGRLGLLPQLFDTITVPAAVAAELKSVLLPDWVRVVSIPVVSIPQGAIPHVKDARLGRGETEAIHLALHLRPDSSCWTTARAAGRHSVWDSYGCARTAGGCQTNRASPGGSPRSGHVADFRIPCLGGSVQGTSRILWRDLSPVVSSRAETRQRGIAECIPAGIATNCGNLELLSRFHGNSEGARLNGEGRRVPQRSRRR